jgi:hypothetical protein
VGSNLSEVLDFLRAFKICGKPLFRGEVKLEAPCGILPQVKELTTMKDIHTQTPFTSPRSS